MSTTIDLTKSASELDQEDIFARLDYEFDEVPVLLQRRGVIESDVQTALETLNSRGQKVGAVIIVTMPRLMPESRDAPGPRYFMRYAVQVIVWPVAAYGPTGAGYTTEAITETVIDLVHYLNFGRGGTLVFDGADPVSVKPGRVSYMAYFRRLGVLGGIKKTACPGIEPVQLSPSSIQITLTCAEPAAEVWYTTDGSWPVPGGATSVLYDGPFTVTQPCTVRATAVADGEQQSNGASADVTPSTSS
jgi:hypothetical protein